MPIRKEIVKTAREYINTPCHHQGRAKGVGVDCIGLIACVSKDLGLGFADRSEFRNYKRLASANKALMTRHLDALCPKSPNRTWKKWKLGDILIFWVNPSHQRPQHMGIATEKGIIHANTQMRKVVEQPLELQHKERFIASYSFPGITHG